MSEQVMVIVADLDDPKHGEINVVESVHKGARLVETLLEAGFDEARIRVFSGAEMDMRVRHRRKLGCAPRRRRPECRRWPRRDVR